MGVYHNLFFYLFYIVLLFLDNSALPVHSPTHDASFEPIKDDEEIKIEIGTFSLDQSQSSDSLGLILKEESKEEKEGKF